MNRAILPIALLIGFLTLSLDAQAEEKVFRLGMIGLDTSHVTAFTDIINKAEKKYGCKVVAGYPGGSPDINISASRVEKFTQQLRDKYGVEIVDTIEELCGKVVGRWLAGLFRKGDDGWQRALTVMHVPAAPLLCRMATDG